LTGTRVIPAWLVVWAVMAAVAGEPPTTTENASQDDPGRTVSPGNPMHVNFRLADGVRVSGELTSWDDEGFDGTFGRRQWSDLMFLDARKLILRVIDPRTAEAWVRAGTILLGLEGGEQAAERIFERALRMDESVRPAIEAAREKAEETRRMHEEAAAAADAERLATITPEAKQWPATPWPPLTMEERQQAVGEMREAAERMLRDSGAPIVPVMSQYFIVYSDMERIETARWARRMDKMCDRLMKLFGVTEKEGVFWGKPAAFLLKDRDRYQLIEAQAFRHLSPSSVTGITHKDGPRIFINVHRQDDVHEFETSLLHEVVHGFMHRYVSPRRLPAWANEGLADYMVSEMLDHESIVDDRLRPEGLRFIRAGGNVGEIMTLTYEDGTWPGRDEVGRGVAVLITERMIAEDKLAYASWVDAVKLGKEWDEALMRNARTTPSDLAWLVSRYYMVND
jgi:hypothetical protein